MAKEIERKVVRFSDYMGPADDREVDKYERFLGRVGLLIIMQTERHNPVKDFLVFYPFEPERTEQRYFYTPLGDLTVENVKIKHNTGHRFVFEEGDFLSADEAEDIYSRRTWSCYFMLW